MVMQQCVCLEAKCWGKGLPAIAPKLGGLVNSDKRQMVEPLIVELPQMQQPNLTTSILRLLCLTLCKAVPLPVFFSIHHL